MFKPTILAFREGLWIDYLLDRKNIKLANIDGTGQYKLREEVAALREGFFPIDDAELFKDYFATHQ
jgi:hypothetical protein